MTSAEPWTLTTAPGTSSYTVYRDPDADPPALVGMYLPPLLEHLGLAELTHDARNNKVRAR
jgi:hypothetical protein